MYTQPSLSVHRSVVSHRHVVVAHVASHSRGMCVSCRGHPSWGNAVNGNHTSDLEHGGIACKSSTLTDHETLDDFDKYLNDEIINRYLKHYLTWEDEHISSNVSGRKREKFTLFQYILCYLSQQCMVRRIVILIFVDITTTM